MKVILKAGGAIMADPEQFRSYLENIISFNKHGPVIAVVSAFKGVTDLLLYGWQGKDFRELGLEFLELYGNDALFLSNQEFYHRELRNMDYQCQVLRQYPNDLKALDTLITAGERFSVKVLDYHLRLRGIKSQVVFPGSIGFRGDNNYQNGKIDLDCVSEVKDKLSQLFVQGIIPILPGYYVDSSDGLPLTLGRGASDQIAAFLGYALGAQVYLLKETHAVLSMCPSDNAATVDCLSYNMAREVGKIIQRRALQWVEKGNLELIIANNLNPNIQTLINSEGPQDTGVKVIRIQEGNFVEIFDIPDEPAMLYGLLSNFKDCNIVGAGDTPNSVCLFIEQGDIILPIEKIRSTYPVKSFPGHFIKLVGNLNFSLKREIAEFTEQEIGFEPVGYFGNMRNAVTYSIGLPYDESIRDKLVVKLHRRFIEQ